MKTITLNTYNATLRLQGDENTRSLDLKTIAVQQWPETGTLTLTVIDEKDMPIYNRHFIHSDYQADATIEINERFVFYDHLSVHLASEPAESNFEVIISFE